MNEEDDGLEALTKRLQNAETKAYSEAFRRFYPALERYARSIVGAEVASDVVQDVFLTLWEKRNDLNIKASLKAMLYTMVRNRALNVNRRRKKVADDVIVEETESFRREAGGPDPGETLEEEDLRARIYRWVGELPERRAEAFTLSRYHGLSHEEIADVMNVSKRTTETHVYHALRDLRERLEALQNEEE